MFIELHAPTGAIVYHNIDNVLTIGLNDQKRTCLCYSGAEFVVQETVATVMGMIMQAKMSECTVYSPG